MARVLRLAGLVGVVSIDCNQISYCSDEFRRLLGRVLELDRDDVIWLKHLVRYSVNRSIGPAAVSRGLFLDFG
jgi:hypothetical protein